MSQAATATGPQIEGKLIQTTDDHIVLGIPGTDYKLHLVPTSPVTPDPQSRVRGIIRAQAQRVDVVGTGGRFVEPVCGRPRRVQGRVISGDVSANTITVHAGAGPFTVTLTDPRQKTADFAKGQMVGFDVKRGATFERVSGLGAGVSGD